MIRADQDVTITMAAGEWQLVMQGCAELPYKLVAGVIAKLEQNFREAAPEAFEQASVAAPVPNGHAEGRA